MTHFNFVLFILVLYTMYYLGNIVYDLIQQKRTERSAFSQGDVLDVSALLNEEYSPIDASALLRPVTPPVGNEVSQEKEERARTDRQETFPLGEEMEESSAMAESISNVTNHGGYSIAQLREIFSEVSSGGDNPLLGITSKMV